MLLRLSFSLGVNLKMKQIRYSSEKKGYCNICGNFDQLTFDHVPPKGCVGINKRNAVLLSEAMGCENFGWHKSRTFQNGLKFRSICENCNSKLLGIKYDPFLKQFTSDISQVVDLSINKGFVFPKSITVNISLQRVVRSIIGHTMAAYVREKMTEPSENIPYIESLRNYFLNDSEPIPDNLQIYYWVYPSEIQVIILGCSLSYFGRKTQIIGDLMKFYPAAFWIVWDPPDEKIELNPLISKRNLGIDEQTEVPVSYFKPPPIDWPENPRDNQFVLLNSEVAYVTKRKERKI